MDVEEFRSKIKSNIKIFVEDKEYSIKEVVRFRLDDGSYYIKCFLNDGYVFADDANDNSYLLVREVKTEFKPPFPGKLDFDGKELNFLYEAHAIAEDVDGEEIFKKGDAERFWDFKADNYNYLSLGINDTTKERLDFFGRIIASSDVHF